MNNFFFPEQVPKDDLAVNDADLVHRFEHQRFFAVLNHKCLQITHSQLLHRDAICRARAQKNR